MEFLLLLCSIIICIINIRFVPATLISLHITCIHLHLQFRYIVTHILTQGRARKRELEYLGRDPHRTSTYSSFHEIFRPSVLQAFGHGKLQDKSRSLRLRRIQNQEGHLRECRRWFLRREVIISWSWANLL